MTKHTHERRHQAAVDMAFGTSLAEQELDRRVAEAYGPEPTGCSQRVACELDPLNTWFGVITGRERWPRQAAFGKGQEVRYRYHAPKKRLGQVGIVAGFSREAPSARGFELGYMSSAGGNKVVVAWPDGSLSKVRPGDLEVAS